MRVNKSLIIKIAIVCSIIFVGLSLYAVVIFMSTFSTAKEGRQRMERLLCETDFHALLEACREIEKMYTRGDLKKSQYMIRINPDPEVLKFPKIILDLEPSYINIQSDGKVQVELYGGFVHFGVCAYPDDYKARYRSFSYGDRELISGLWYYDDGYVENPEYDRKIDSLIEEYKEKK